MSSDKAPHLVRSYESELRQLRTMMTTMGGLVEHQLLQALGAVSDRNSDAATAAIAADPVVDQLESDIEAFVIRLIALRQPLAGDLRHVVAALKITNGLERIGDYARNIAKRSGVLHQFTLPFSLDGLNRMGRLVCENLRITIDAIGEADANKAEAAWRSDQAIDDVYTGLFRELITYMMEDPRNITPCTHLLFMAKNLERIGDHATNIAETIHYAVTGEALPGVRPKGDSSATTFVHSSDSRS